MYSGYVVDKKTAILLLTPTLHLLLGYLDEYEPKTAERRATMEIYQDYFHLYLMARLDKEMRRKITSDGVLANIIDFGSDVHKGKYIWNRNQLCKYLIGEKEQWYTSINKNWIKDMSHRLFPYLFVHSLPIPKEISINITTFLKN